MGNGFVHIELTTGDVGKAKKFYKSLFDWKFSDIPNMGYTIIDAGKKTIGGGMQKPPMPGAPHAWLPYVEVSDVKKTLAKAKKGGATIVLDYQAIGAMGAMGVFLDPSGSALGVWEPAKKKAPKKRAKKTAKKKK